MPQQSCKPIGALLGFILTTIWMIIAASTNVFVCKPPSSFTDADGVPLSCSWSMFHHTFTGPLPTAGEVSLAGNRATNAASFIQQQRQPHSLTTVTLGAVIVVADDASGEDTTMAPQPSDDKSTTTTDDDKSTTTTANDANQTTTDDGRSETTTTPDSNATTTAAEETTTNSETEATTDLSSSTETETTTADDQTTEANQTTETTTTKPPSGPTYASKEVSTKELTCDALRVRLQVMAAFTVITILLSFLGLLFAVFLFMGLQYCGATCHHSSIAMVIAILCAVGSFIVWVVGANIYWEQFEGKLIPVEFQEANPSLSVSSSSSFDSVTNAPLLGNGAFSLSPSSSSSLMITRTINVPSCYVTSFKNSPFEIYYGAGWALPFVSSMLFALLALLAYKVDRSGHYDSVYDNGGGAGEVGDFNTVIINNNSVVTSSQQQPANAGPWGQSPQYNQQQPQQSQQQPPPLPQQQYGGSQPPVILSYQQPQPQPPQPAYQQQQQHYHQYQQQAPPSSHYQQPVPQQQQQQQMPPAGYYQQPQPSAVPPPGGQHPHPQQYPQPLPKRQQYLQKGI